ACSLAVAVYGLSDSVALESLRHTPFRLSLTPDEQEFELALADRMHRLGYLERQVSADQLYSR
ncbi:MAG: hypothetical protein ABIK62_06300, partial [candidate division WOR-3 bacterium]